MEWTQKQIQAEKQNFDTNKGFIYNEVQDDKNGTWNTMTELRTNQGYDLRTKKMAWSTMYKGVEAFN